MFSTYPAVACFTLTLSLANSFGIPFCILIPFTGYLTLQWCVSCDHWFITGSKAAKSNETLWKSLQDMCIFLLLRIFPLVSYLSEITDGFLHHLLNLALLYSITELFASLLAYTRSTSVRTRSIWQTSAFHHILFASMFAISFPLVSLRFVDFARRGEIQLVFLAIGLFICLLGSSLLHIRRPTFPIYRKCSFIIIVLLSFLCLFASSRFPKVANIIPWRGFLPSPFGLTLATCCLFSIVPVALHDCVEDEAVHFVIAAFLSAFQLNELHLFQSRLISGNLFIGSSMIILVCLYSIQMLKLKEARSYVYSRREPVTDDLINVFLIAPLLTKLVLVGLNKWDQFDRDFDIINHARKSDGHVLRCNSGMVLGLYLSCVGLTNGSRIANWFTRLAHLSRLKLLTLNDAIIGMLGLLFYFIVSLGLHWHICVQLLFGSVQSLNVLLFPAGVLLTGCSIHLPQKWLHPQPGRNIRNDHCSYNSIAMNFILLAVFSLFAMISSRTVTFSFLLLTLLLPAAVFLLFWTIHRLIFTGSENPAFSRCWLTRSIRCGLFGGPMLTVLVLWFEPVLSGCALLGCTTLYSTCIGVLTESRNATANLSSISDCCGSALTLNTLPSQPSDGLGCSHLRSTLCLRRKKLRFELTALLHGLVSLGMLPVFRWFAVAGAWTKPSFPIFGTFALAFLILGQISADRRATESRYGRRRKSSVVDAKLRERCAEDTLLTSLINVSVLICVVLLLYGYSRYSVFEPLLYSNQSCELFMERILAVASRHALLPYDFCLTSASVLRPFHIRWPTMASILTVSAASPNPSDPLHASGCPMEELNELLRRGVSVDPIIGRFRAWWDTVRLPASSEPNIGISWPTYTPEDAYKEPVRIDYVAQRMFTQLGLKTMPPLTDYEVGIAVNLVDTRVLSTEWNSIGGLDEVIDAIQQSVIEPFQQVPLVPYYSRLLRPPKGVLLFGPPGCGKTMLARAMARAANAYFINLQISALVNMWYGETQKYVEATFSLAHKLQPSIIFIDELGPLQCTFSLSLSWYSVFGFSCQLYLALAHVTAESCGSLFARSFPVTLFGR
ncbi:uncharacterized protein DEA37_0012799 [Paragonimus westermani]|uniref:AAA+ ATPase domain-containing protein n=1 Tax=Paragonimus westermani TaxID=34504 RepID=A0A5J4NI97_9TREM|nr:uncharacterized protein DEA37_0012799 [Paragonimus westermani]